MSSTWCTVGYLIFQFFHMTATLILLFASLVFGINALRNLSYSKSPLLHNSSIIFIIFSILAFSFFIAKNGSKCYSATIYHYMDWCFFLCYGDQWVFLLISYFIRLYLLFKDTKFKLNQYNISIHIILMSIVEITVIMCHIFQLNPNHARSINHIGMMIVATLNIILSTSITHLIVRKLYQLYKIKYEAQTELSLITKNAILSFISI